MQKAGYMDLNFDSYFEPEGGISSPREFTDELLAWAEREQKDITILEESMEPVIKMNGDTFVCRLGTPDIASQNNKLWKFMGFKGINQSVGRFLGYKWVYLYPTETGD